MIVHVIIAGLAGWRLASLLVVEGGPFDVFEKLRALAGIPRVGVQAPRPLIGGILACTWCCSFYTVAGAWAAGEFLSWTLVAVTAALALPPLVQTWVDRK